jgi:uncharacterized protein (TIGR01777 family)
MIVEHRSSLPALADEAFAWHARPGAFERLLPPWERIRLAAPAPELAVGARVTLSLRAGPMPVRWVARIAGVEPGRAFTDVQEEGPFARWKHEHRFEPTGSDRCDLLDRVEVELPWGPLGELGEPMVRRRLMRALRYRHRTAAGDLQLQSRYSGPRLQVAVSGASGLIGSVLCQMLTTGGHRVVKLVRRPAGAGEVTWDPRRRLLEPEALSGCDAVVHLAGENIGGGRWSARQRERLRASRLVGTSLLAGAIARASRPPRVLVAASAIGFYGDRGDLILDEASPAGHGFLAGLGQAWEAASDAARDAGVRTVLARFGLVLSPRGGVLGRMLPVFRLGLGGPLGDGRQWMSWIGLDDAVAAILHCLWTDAVTGPVNVVSAEPARNAEFARVLGRVLRRPAVLPAPAFALRLAFDGLAEEGLLASHRVRPAVLEQTGFTFRHPTLEAALRHGLGRRAP